MNEYAERHQIFRLDQLSVKKMCNESKMLTHLFIFRFLLESYEYDSVLVRLINDHPKQKKKKLYN